MDHHFRMSINDTKKSKKGRPPADTSAVNLRLSRSVISEIDEYRRAQQDIPSRPEAIRQLIHTGLAARPILAEVQSMLLHLTRNNPDADLDRYIETIHKALNSEK